MKRSRFVLLSLILDVVLVYVGFIVAFLVRFSGSLPAYNFTPFLQISPIIICIYLASGWFNNLYEPQSYDDEWTIIRKVVVSATMGTIFTAVVAFLGGTATVSFARLTLLISWPIVGALLILWRFLFMRFGSIAWPKQKILVLGTSQTALDLVNEIDKRAHWGWTCLGVITEKDVNFHVAGIEQKILGCFDDLEKIVEKTDADRIIIVNPSKQREFVEEISIKKRIGIRIDVVPDLYEVCLGDFDSQIGDIPLVHIIRIRKPAYFSAIKRGADMLFGCILAVLFTPVMFLVGVAIFVEDRGPVFYKQERIGRNQKPFMIIKLRTMKMDAETLSGPVLAEEADPRITKVGSVLRRYRIDEIAQVFNIISGDMSFVGPRPERQFFIKDYLLDIPGYAERFRIRPGVTGLAQTSGGYATTAERKLKYDLIYLYHRSFALDIRILLETCRVVLTSRGSR